MLYRKYTRFMYMLIEFVSKGQCKQYKRAITIKNDFEIASNYLAIVIDASARPIDS